METRYTGRVFKCNFRRRVGFIGVDGRPNSWRSRLFFHCSDVIPDVFNRRVIPEGSPVSFEIVLDKDGRKRAVKVRNEHPSLRRTEAKRLEKPATMSGFRDIEEHFLQARELPIDYRDPVLR